MMKSARISYALARSGDLPTKLAIVAATGIPRWALGVSSLLAMVFAATGTYETVVAMNVAVGLVIVIAVNLAVMRLRRSEPDLARPFRMPWFPLPALLAIALNAVLLAALMYEDPMHSLAGLVALALIAGIYSVIQRAPRAQVA